MFAPRAQTIALIHAMGGIAIAPHPLSYLRSRSAMFRSITACRLERVPHRWHRAREPVVRDECARSGPPC